MGHFNSISLEVIQLSLIGSLALFDLRCFSSEYTLTKSYSGHPVVVCFRFIGPGLGIRPASMTAILLLQTGGAEMPPVHFALRRRVSRVSRPLPFSDIAEQVRENPDKTTIKRVIRSSYLFALNRSFLHSQPRGIIIRRHATLLTPF